MYLLIEQFLSMWGVCIVAVVITCTLTPFPSVFCFHVAWEPKTSKQAVTLQRALLVLPTAIFPVILLVMHGIASDPTWQVHGPDAISYIALGDACWVFLLPFSAANYVVDRTILNRDFITKTHLPPLALLTCFLICLYFAIGNWDREFYWCFPLSAACGYAYGLRRLVGLQNAFLIARFHVLLLIGWCVSSVGTVYAAVIASRAMVATLPEENPDCFIVTAASKGHPSVVGSWREITTGQLVNNQLRTFRKFEQRLTDEYPAIHSVARTIYNVVGPTVARCVVFRWQADLIYLMLKPLELLIRGGGR